MESSQIEYITQQNCNLTQVGGLLDSKGYGIALPVSKHQLVYHFPVSCLSICSPLIFLSVDSPYRTHISQAVLKMQEDGKLHQLKEKWWVEMNPGAGECSADDGGQSATPELGMGNVGGVFLVLGAGLVVGIFVGIIDFLWNIRQISIEERVNYFDVHAFYLS